MSRGKCTTSAKNGSNIQVVPAKVMIQKHELLAGRLPLCQSSECLSAREHLNGDIKLVNVRTSMDVFS